MSEHKSDEVTGGAAVVDALVAHGVRDVFGIPGTHNLEVYRYLPDSGIRHVVTRHEQGAGYAADGYARVSGMPGVLITTSGPGITNAITALATAYADSVPVLAISPGPPNGRVGADVGWLHEVKNQQAALDAVCRRSIRVVTADEIPDVLAAVFDEFATLRPRPVHLEVPVDVLEGPWLRRPTPVRSKAQPVGPGRPRIEELAAALDGSRSPLLVAGGGARRATEEIRALADYGLPVLTTVNGKGILDETHPGALGAGIRLPAAHRALNDADLVIVVGVSSATPTCGAALSTPAGLASGPSSASTSTQPRCTRTSPRTFRSWVTPRSSCAGSSTCSARTGSPHVLWRQPSVTRSLLMRLSTRPRGRRSSGSWPGHCPLTPWWQGTARR